MRRRADVGLVREGDTVGILPGDDARGAGAFVDVALPTGLGHIGNTIVIRADAVIAIGGAAGTLSQRRFAWLHERHIVALHLPDGGGRPSDSTSACASRPARSTTTGS